MCVFVYGWWWWWLWGGLKDRRTDKKSCVCESCDENGASGVMVEMMYIFIA